MPVFTLKERVAVAVLALLVLAGWGVRLWRDGVTDGGVTVIRHAVEPPQAVTAAGGRAGADDGITGMDAGRIDINTAGPAELERLPMIGPSRAAAIIEYRERHGPFATPADITGVPGIGPVILERIRPLVTTGADSTAAERSER